MIQEKWDSKNNSLTKKRPSEKRKLNTQKKKKKDSNISMVDVKLNILLRVKREISQLKEKIYVTISISY